MVFLDRDGTINIYKGFIRSQQDMELIPGIANMIKKINSSGYLAIVVTNQPVIARGEYSVEELGRIHEKMETLLVQGALILMICSTVCTILIKDSRGSGLSIR